MSDISVVIPAHNQQEWLTESLRTLEPNLPHIREVIVVDDASATPLTAPDWVNMIRINHAKGSRGSSAAKNFGARFATGDWLCFSDADTLHLPDAFESLARTRDAWVAEKRPNMIISVWRVPLPEGFPPVAWRDLDRLLTACRASNLLADEYFTRGACYYDHGCALISRETFESAGGYDEIGFPSWGFNNHDLDLRVAAQGGGITSSIERVSTPGRRLYCFHMWHEAKRESDTAEREFAARWGESWHPSLIHKVREDNGQRVAVQG